MNGYRWLVNSRVQNEALRTVMECREKKIIEHSADGEIGKKSAGDVQ